jgi:hypothetical protein
MKHEEPNKQKPKPLYGDTFVSGRLKRNGCPRLSATGTAAQYQEEIGNVPNGSFSINLLGVNGVATPMFSAFDFSELERGIPLLQVSCALRKQRRALNATRT